MPPTVVNNSSLEVNSPLPNKALCFESAEKALPPLDTYAIDGNDISLNSGSHNSSVTVPIQLQQQPNHSHIGDITAADSNLSSSSSS